MYWVGGGEEGTDVLCHPHRRLHTGAVSSHLGVTISDVGLFQCIFSKITGFGFQLLLEISQQDNMISLDICQRGGGVNGFCENLVTGGVKMTGNSCV